MHVHQNCPPPLPLLKRHYLSILKMIVKILEIGYPKAIGKQHKWLIVLDIRRNLITSQDPVMMVFLNLHLHLPLRSQEKDKNTEMLSEDHDKNHK